MRWGAALRSIVARDEQEVERQRNDDRCAANSDEIPGLPNPRRMPTTVPQPRRTSQKQDVHRCDGGREGRAEQDRYREASTTASSPSLQRQADSSPRVAIASAAAAFVVGDEGAHARGQSSSCGQRELGDEHGHDVNPTSLSGTKA
jgi:hypothetical protein